MLNKKEVISMDNGTLNELMKKIKNKEFSSPHAVDDLINKNLTPSQAATVNKILQDPQMISRLLSSEQAKQLLGRLADKEE